MKKIAMENAYIIDIWDRKRLIKYSLNYNFNKNSILAVIYLNKQVLKPD